MCCVYVHMTKYSTSQSSKGDFLPYIVTWNLLLYLSSSLLQVENLKFIFAIVLTLLFLFCFSEQGYVKEKPKVCMFILVIFFFYFNVVMAPESHCSISINKEVGGAMKIGLGLCCKKLDVKNMRRISSPQLFLFYFLQSKCILRRLWISLLFSTSLSLPFEIYQETGVGSQGPRALPCSLWEGGASLTHSSDPLMRGHCFSPLITV